MFKFHVSCPGWWTHMDTDFLWKKTKPVMLHGSPKMLQARDHHYSLVPETRFQSRSCHLSVKINGWLLSGWWFQTIFGEIPLGNYLRWILSLSWDVIHLQVVARVLVSFMPSWWFHVFVEKYDVFTLEHFSKNFVKNVTKSLKPPSWVRWVYWIGSRSGLDHSACHLIMNEIVWYLSRFCG